MPELPEVRTVRAFLNTFKGQTFVKIDSFYEKMFPKALCETLKNQTIKEVSSLGKYLIIHLTDYDLISHLRMEGKYYYKETYEPTKHDHVIFSLNHGFLYYNDTRKFGTFDVKTTDTYTTKPLSLVAKEPFTITDREFHDKIKNSSRAIKTLLLDQKIISGIGNIYADEILFLSKINPKRKGSSLKKSEIKEIILKSIFVLSAAIKKGGTSLHTFTSNQEAGWFQLDLYVHTKASKPCKICNTLIKKEKIGGRTSYYCEHCQK